MLKALLFLCIAYSYVDGWGATETDKNIGQRVSGLSLAFSRMETQIITPVSNVIVCEKNSALSSEDEDFLSRLTLSNLLRNLGYCSKEIEFQLEELKLSRIAESEGERFLELYRAEYLKLLEKEDEKEVVYVSKSGTASIPIPIPMQNKNDECDLRRMSCSGRSYSSMVYSGRSYSGTTRGFSSYGQRDLSEYLVKREALVNAYLVLEKSNKEK